MIAFIELIERPSGAYFQGVKIKIVKIHISLNLHGTFTKLALNESLYNMPQLNAWLEKMLICIIMNINEHS